MRSMGWRYLRRRKVRYALTTLGIVLGVANVFGVLVSNATTSETLKRRGLVAGGADVVAFSRGERFSAEMSDRLRRLPDARTVALFGDLTTTDGRERGRVVISTADQAGLREFAEPRLIRGRLIRPGAPEVLLTEAAARALRVGLGDHIRIFEPQPYEALSTQTPNPEVRTRSVVVAGLLRDQRDYEDASVGSFTSIEFIWDITGVRDATTAYFFLDDGVDPADWASERGAELPSAEFRPTGLAGEFRRFIDILQGAMSGAAAIAVFVGAFLIYLTFSMTVVERTRIYGTLHAVGATGGQVGRGVLAEALLLGAVASAAGLALGAVVAVGLLGLTSRIIHVPHAGLVVSPSALALGVVVGLGATLVGSLVPALRAARIAPVEAIRGLLATSARPSRAWPIGGVLVAGGVALSVSNHGIDAPSFVGQAATFAVLLGAVLIVPPILGPLVRVGRSFIRSLTGVLGDVSLMHLTREHSRSSYTVGLVMVVLAMMLVLASAAGSVSDGVTRWVDKRFGADLLAYRSPMPARAEEAVAHLPDVTAVTSVSFDQVRMQQPRRLTQNIVVIDPERFFDIAGFPWDDGDDAAARRALASGGHVLLPARFAAQIGAERGDRVVLRTLDGNRSFEVAGIYASFATGPEVGVVVGRADRRSFFPEDGTNVLYVNLKPDASIRQLRSAIDDAIVGELVRSGERPPEAVVHIGGRPTRSGVVFVEGADIKAGARREVREYFSLFYAVLFVAVVVGLLGLANTMATSVIQRYREIGILQAVGAGPVDVRRMVLVESALLVGVAFVLSIALGTLLSRLLIDGISGLIGFEVPFVFPWAWIPILGVLSALIALAAALAPARRAARLTPVEALRYE